MIKDNLIDYFNEGRMSSKEFGEMIEGLDSDVDKKIFFYDALQKGDFNITNIYLEEKELSKEEKEIIVNYLSIADKLKESIINEKNRDTIYAQ